jgi:predicted metal-dependent phosphoesterase TrpH
VRIDLHTHSDRSDGTTPPGDLVRAARQAGLDVVALTDHDTAAGWPEAAEAALEVGITLVRGMEISCKHAGRGLHLLAYLPDPAYPPLREELQGILDGRDQRTPRICAQLREHGIDISETDVARHARGAVAVGRPHVADTLVSMGVVADRDEAFERLLSPGRPGYVRRYAPAVESMLEVVRAAGGVSVVAHPWGRTDRSALLEEGLDRLRGLGLVGVEVDHEDHGPREREELRGIARNLDLVVTGSSDHHGAGKVGHDLGCNTTDPEQYERLVELASRSAAAAAPHGRSAPRPVSQGMSAR